MTRATDVLRKLPPPRDKAALDAARAVRALLRGTPPGPRSRLAARLEKAFKTGDARRIQRVLGELHQVNALAQRLASPPGMQSGVPLAETSGTQSVQFMIDLLPHIQQLLAEQPRGRSFDVLDVGPGTGMGTALLASLYRQPRLGYRMHVSALDISATYRWFLAAVTPHVPFVQEDVFDHEKTYDIVIASHVIEHLADPVPFVRRLQELARLAVFVVAPFNEPVDNLTQGHVSVIDDALMKELDPVEWSTMHSVSWGAFMEPHYDMVIARLAGRAT